MDHNSFENKIEMYRKELNENGKLNLSLDECRNLFNNDYYVVVKDGFVIDIKTKE